MYLTSPQSASSSESSSEFMGTRLLAVTFNDVDAAGLVKEGPGALHPRLGSDDVSYVPTSDCIERQEGNTSMDIVNTPGEDSLKAVCKRAEEL